MCDVQSGLARSSGNGVEGKGKGEGDRKGEGKACMTYKRGWSRAAATE